jgi:Mn2+/Fe2+ NRAMP family transporter
MENLINFVPEQLFILIAVLYVLGMLFKSIPKIQDWTIPWILLIISIIGAIGIEGLSIMAVLEGVICCGVSVLTNQLIKQTQKKEGN